MKKKYLEVGKCVGTHGVKGMIRFQPWADNADFLKQFKYLYTDDNGKNRVTLLRVQPHGNIALIALKGVETIEHAETFRNTVLYIDRADAKLPEDRYFIADLIGISVTDVDTGEKLGVIGDVSQTGANDVWHIIKDGKEYLIPVIDEVIISVDIENDMAYIRPLKGIFDDEN